MKTKLKEGSKPAKKYYKNGDMKSNLDKVIAKSNECTETISAAKDKVNVWETKRSFCQRLKLIGKY